MASTPPLEWAGSVGGDQIDDVQVVEADDAGNVYSMGTFLYSADFDPGPGVFTLTNDNFATFVRKQDPNGELIWAVKMTDAMPPDPPVCVPGVPNGCLPGVTNGPRYGLCIADIRGLEILFGEEPAEICVGSPTIFPYAEARDIAVDDAGNVYISGYFQGKVDFDPGPGVRELDALTDDAFLIKLNPQGMFEWVGAMGGTGRDIAMGVAVDDANRVLVTGMFERIADFDPGPGVSPLMAVPPTPLPLTESPSDTFVAKLDSTGELVWARSMGGPGFDVGRAIDVDGAGNVLTAGYFELLGDFDPGLLGVAPLIASDPLTTPVVDAFVSKLDTDGNYVWAGSLGGSGYDDAFDVAAGPDGGVHTIGAYCGGNADFDPGPARRELPGAAEKCFTYVSTLDSDGGFAWARSIGRGNGNTVPEDIAAADDGAVVASGSFRRTVDLDPGPGALDVSTPTGDGFDVDGFLVELDALGGFVWGGRIGGPGYDPLLGMTVDGTGDVLAGGSFYGTADFDPGPGTFTMTSIPPAPDAFWYPSGDGFVLKLNREP